MIYFLRRSVAIFLSILLAIMPLSATHAAMIGNDQIIGQGSAYEMRDSLQQHFEREIIQQQLVAWGVNPEQARSRIDNLTDEEVALIVRQIDDPRAGSGAAGIILTILLVFVITDIIGATDIYPFINSVN